MSEVIEDYTTGIPAAPYYVFAVDDFFRDRFEGKTEVLVFPCSSIEEAKIVEGNCINFASFARNTIRISEHPPTPGSTVVHSLMQKDDAVWYRPGGITPTIEEKFQGWTNRATWSVALVLDNTEPLYKEAHRLIAIDPSGEKLKAFVLKQAKISGTELDQEFQDQRSALDRVNWKEITAHYEEGVLEDPKLLRLRRQTLGGPSLGGL